jgi:hypothetical protein
MLFSDCLRRSSLCTAGGCLLVAVMVSADDKVPPPVQPKTEPLPIRVETLGRFTLEINGTFKQKLPTGSDHQEENGNIEVRIEKQTGSGASYTAHKLAGSGQLGWFETVTSTGCSFTASAKLDLRISGTVRPFPYCNMDIKFHWSKGTIYPMGSCHGFPLDPFDYSAHESVLPEVELPVSEGEKSVFYLENGYKMTVVYRNVKLDYVGLGCVDKGD